MSLLRFVNSSEIIESRGRLQGIVIPVEDLRTISRDISILENASNKDISIESHIYNGRGEYITTNYSTAFTHSTEYKDFLFDISTIFDSLNLVNGSYKISLSFLINLLGSYDAAPLFLEEISPDRTELKFLVKKSYIAQYPDILEDLNVFKEQVTSLKVADRIANLVINFGLNNIFQIVNVKVDCRGDDAIVYFKLYSPISEDVIERQSAFVGFKVLEDYVDNFLLKPTVKEDDVINIGDPDFDVDDDDDGGDETPIETWNTLLDADTSTTARIVNEMFSGSAEIPLNIDWSDFSNFVIYGSAAERLKNYKYKLELIEFFDSKKQSILGSTASGSASIINLANTYRGRTDNIIGGLDQFEKYLYTQTGSIFSYDVSGSITPSPKYVESGRYVNYNTTSSLFTQWYNTLLTSATEYDRTNYDSLYYNTPDHILRDTNNSQYILFIHMIGQHFDNIYAYVKELTSIHRRDEHPQRGIPNKLLPHYARSLGWKLQNNKSLSDLWLYKLGTDQSGSLSVPSGSLVSRPHEVLSEQVWRRVVNNLPFLLKTKGTDRSIRALFSMYGIPFTLISVKEYGGPRVESSKPNLMEDRFQYLLNLDGDQYIELDRRLEAQSANHTPQIPQTTELRFRTAYTSSVSMSLWSLEESDNRNNVLHNLELIPYTSSLYGKNTYGYLRYTAKTGSRGDLGAVVGTSSLLPIYDNDIWTVRMYAQTPIYNGSTFDGNLYIDVAKASAFVDGNLSLSSSFSVYGEPNQLLYTLGAVSQLFQASSSFFDDNHAIDSLILTGGIISQIRDELDEVLFPADTSYTGSIVSTTFSSVEEGNVFILPGTVFTGSFTSGSEFSIPHNSGTQKIIGQTIDSLGHIMVPSKFRIIDDNNVGVTLSTDEVASVVVASSGSIIYSADIDIQTYPFALGTQVTQSNPFPTNTVVVQIFDENKEEIIPERVKVGSDVLVTFSSPESGSIHLARGTTLNLDDSPHKIIVGGSTGSAGARFSGSIQGYKEYFGAYDYQVFKEHVLNPGGYYGNTYTSSYDDLFRYYPLGTDNLKHDHSTYSIVSSSHPNQARLVTSSLATFYNFTGSDSNQYSSVSEIYYSYYPSLGANMPKSHKIREEDAYLTGQLSPDRKVEVSRYDTQQNDTNRLAIVFSPTDQINRDVANQFGSYNFENFIGDPQHGGDDYYPDLNIARDAYFKKFARANDIGRYIEIFSLYDYAVFDQIKQLVPGRSNLIAGVLIEPSVLERPKVKRTQPEISILNHPTTLDGKIKDPEGFILPLKAVIEPPIILDIERVKKETTIENPITLDIERVKKETTIENPITLDIERVKKETTIENPLLVSVARSKHDTTLKAVDAAKLGATYTPMSSSVRTVANLNGNVIGGQAVEEEISYVYKRNGVSVSVTKTINRYHNFSGERRAVKSDLYTNQHVHDFDRMVGTFFVSSSGGIIPYSASQLLSDDYNFYITTDTPAITSSYAISGTKFANFINAYDYFVYDRYEVIYRRASRGTLNHVYISGSSTNPNYKRVVYHYSSSGVFANKYDRNFNFAVSKSLGLYYSSSLEDANYQHFERSRLGGLRFQGSKITGAGINVDSTETISGGPVVRITLVEDNELVV